MDVNQLLRFSFVGILNTAIAYIVYCLAIRIGLHYQFANVLGFFVSVINAYIWSVKYVFRVHRGSISEHMASFSKTLFSYSLTGILLNGFLLYLLIDTMNQSCYIAQAFALLITVPTNFVLNKYWAFRK